MNEKLKVVEFTDGSFAVRTSEFSPLLAGFARAMRAKWNPHQRWWEFRKTHKSAFNNWRLRNEKLIGTPEDKKEKPSRKIHDYPDEE